VSGLARVDRTDLLSDKKAAAIAEILKMRDQLVVMRERLFQLTAATAVRTKEVDGLLIDCAGAGRVFGVPDWQMCLGGRQTLKRHTSPSARRLKRTIPMEDTTVEDDVVLADEARDADAEPGGRARKARTWAHRRPARPATASGADRPGAE